jgi:hypothetical protein
METTITFGKFSGWTTEEVAKAGTPGRSYLAWGAKNLKSSKWRSEFERALREVRTADPELILRAWQVNDPDYTPEDEMGEMAAAKAEARVTEEQLGREPEIEAFWTKWTAKMGRSQSELMVMLASGSHYERPEDIPANRFSSPERRAMYIEFVHAFDALCGVE